MPETHKENELCGFKVRAFFLGTQPGFHSCWAHYIPSIQALAWKTVLAPPDHTLRTH